MMYCITQKLFSNPLVCNYGKNVNYWKWYQQACRTMQPSATLSTTTSQNGTITDVITQEDIKEVKSSIPAVVRLMQDKRIIYNSYIDERYMFMVYHNKVRLQKIHIYLKRKERAYNSKAVVSDELALDRTKECEHIEETEITEIVPYEEKETDLKHFPLAQHQDVAIQSYTDGAVAIKKADFTLSQISVHEEMSERLIEYEQGDITPITLHTPEGTNVRSVVKSKQIEKAIRLLGKRDQHFEERPLEKERSNLKFGTADKSVPISTVPCGGCGALLHCQDSALPGFKPREVFVGLSKAELQSTVCQRCHYLSNYNIALQVRVSPESYLKMLEPIKTQIALVVLLVDLTDAPCSIHPGFLHVIARNQPVIVVGTKVDLIPADGKGCIRRLQVALVDVLKQTPLRHANILHTCIVSGNTGFGVEELITAIHYHWRGRGDIFLVGSTNCGKSTLYNALLRSDLCKSQAVDLLMRATTSPWPGTTLNMLKFPIMRTTGNRVNARQRRLEEQCVEKKSPFKTRYTENLQLATFSGKVGRSFETPAHGEIGSTDLFASEPTNSEMMGINERAHPYRVSKWCYDTPGALQPDQMLSLLTHDELMEVLPDKMIVPETYKVAPGRTLFIAGLARIDVLHVHHTEPESIGWRPCDAAILTVFRSRLLPISIVKTVDASAYYRDNLGNELLNVPCGSKERMDCWPALQPADVITVTGVEQGAAASDVVLSSAGWVSVALTPYSVCSLRAWTPGGRGAHLRRMAFLPYAVKTRGEKFKHSVKYRPHTLYNTAAFPALRPYDRHNPSLRKVTTKRKRIEQIC